MSFGGESHRSFSSKEAKDANPYGRKFNYAKEFKKLNLKKLKRDIAKVLTTSQDWWLVTMEITAIFIRMTWHSAGTYRVLDGRGGAAGGQMRFEPLNSWQIIQTWTKQEDFCGD